MNCSYNNGIQDCFGTCVLSDLPADAEAAERLVAQRVGAAGRRALRYFHAEISTESNATTKYADSIMTNSKGEQFFYACDKYYGLFLPTESNSYGKELLRSVDKAFELGFTGLCESPSFSTALQPWPYIAHLSATRSGSPACCLPTLPPRL